MALSTLPVITDESGQKVAAIAIVSVDENGDIIGGTGGSSATSAKQDEQTLLLTAIDTKLGATQTDLPPTPLLAASRFDGRTQVNISTATTTTLIAAGGGSQVGRSYRGALIILGANVLTFNYNGLSTVFEFGSGGGQINWRDEDPMFVTAANGALTLTTSTTAHVTGLVDWQRG